MARKSKSRRPKLPPPPDSPTPAPPPELRPDPANSRLHPDRNRALIRRSLEEVGPGRSILVDGEGVVRAGNGVLAEAGALGIPVRVVDAAPGELIAVRRADLTGERAARAALLDNRAGELAAWDARALAELEQTAPALLEGLFLPEEFDALMAGIAADGAADATPPEEFREYGEDIPCEHRCPKCGYEWSGGAK